ncbi:ribosomal protein L11 methyltransferase [Deinobacterium chartae]|uniref:Ribosomal protein L11 methyltransferase n=1 Tax=Deinobacterium chartae TaxID=521158 RepID=A0A841HWE0_9DEIO|nr:50S ribosomal protein L11 methyltransferase [Deinobacterium chartae]MBB6097236.1 ribosomal protein L11 methyltransferase [Deinobacterium chartae]
MVTYTIPGNLEDLDAETPALWDAGCLGLEEAAGEVRAYFEHPVELPLAGRWQDVPNEDWLERWKRDLTPVTVGRVTVVPSWLEQSVPAGQIKLVIDPGMAFGTGHHATTRFGVRALQELDLRGKRVLDVGAGTGLLALVAAALGARAEGVDLDPITVPIARENAERNGLEARFVEGTLSDILEEGPWDVLVCNLYAELHDALAGEYRAALLPGGPLILTGILEGRLELVRSALEREGFSNVRSELDGEWALVTARRSQEA